MAGWHASDAEPTMAAGHSLGELGALTAAGVLDTNDALELVVLRGRLMAEADDSGSMLALLGGSIEDAEAIAQAAGVTVANDNAPGQVVLSGERGALEEAEEAAREYNVRARPLDVAGAFHSPRMSASRRSARRWTRSRSQTPASPSTAAPPPRRSPTSAASWPRRSSARSAGARPSSPCSKQAPRTSSRPAPAPCCRRWPVASPRRPPMRSAPLAEAARRDGATLRTASVLGLGHHLPEQVVNNLPIAERLGIDDHWIEKRTGIRSRRHAMPHERLSDLATAAGKRALEDAGIDAAELDVVLVATTSADEITPNAAPYVATTLGAGKANAIDIGAACTAFVTALSVAASMIESGRAETVLVIGADALSRFTDFDDKRTAALFGDGAGAIVLGNQDGGGVGPFVFGNDAELAEAIIARRDDPVLRMDGHTTFNSATAALVDSTRDAVELAGLHARRRRPVRLPPGQRPHHEGGRRAARAPDGARRRLHRRHRQHVRRLDPAGARVRARRGPAAPRRHRAGGRRRRRLHVGRRGPGMGRPA